MVWPLNKKKKESENKYAASIVHIKIFKAYESLKTCIAEFDAEQSKDDNYGLIVSGDEDRFKESLEINPHQVIDLLKYKLDLTGKQSSEKIDIVKKKISEQERQIKDYELVDFMIVKDNVKVQINKIDELNKLNYLKILRDVVFNEGSGSFEVINFKGQREMHYDYIQGLLYPVFFSTSKHTTSPANDTKKKIYKEKQDMIDKQFNDEIGGGELGWFTRIMKIAFVILFIALMAGNYYTWAKGAELSNQIANSDIAKLELATARCNVEIKIIYIGTQQRTNSKKHTQIPIN